VARLCGLSEFGVAGASANYSQSQWNGNKPAYQGKRQSRRFALIVIQTRRQQKTNPGAQHNASSSYKDDVCNGKPSLDHFETSFLTYSKGLHAASFFILRL
jgi:hypothetical protein